MSQNGNLPQIGLKIKNIWNHHPVVDGSNLEKCYHWNIADFTPSDPGKWFPFLVDGRKSFFWGGRAGYSWEISLYDSCIILIYTHYRLPLSLSCNMPCDMFFCRRDITSYFKLILFPNLSPLKLSPLKLEQSSFQLGWFGHIGDEKLPSHILITIKTTVRIPTNQPVSMECHCRVLITVQFDVKKMVFFCHRYQIETILARVSRAW